jgi:hypothetical protein
MDILFIGINSQIFASDVILIYRMSGTIDSNTPIWQLILRTLFLTEGELDYDFDFSEDFTIYAGGTYDLSATPQYIDNQTFNCNRSRKLFCCDKQNSYADVMAALNMKKAKFRH